MRVGVGMESGCLGELRLSARPAAQHIDKRILEAWWRRRDFGGPGEIALQGAVSGLIPCDEANGLALDHAVNNARPVEH